MWEQFRFFFSFRVSVPSKILQKLYFSFWENSLQVFFKSGSSFLLFFFSCRVSLLGKIIFKKLCFSFQMCVSRLVMTNKLCYKKCSHSWRPCLFGRLVASNLVNEISWCHGRVIEPDSRVIETFVVCCRLETNSWNSVLVNWQPAECVVDQWFW